MYDLVRNNMTVNERESLSNFSLWHKLMLRNSACLAVQHLTLIMLCGQTLILEDCSVFGNLVITLIIY